MPEWDWPEDRAGRFQRERVIIDEPPRRSGWSSRGATRATSTALKIGINIIKMVVAIPLTLMVIGAVWMIVTLLKNA